ncbi:MAG: NAD-dependent malic enzyme [Myxococcales bacterium]|nr:NAD-dependent malic enzyme [Myxococcales bacterium]MCB9708340.1 NAD-dependent malic enzyme [Myxococcales bacterium]
MDAFPLHSDADGTEWLTIPHRGRAVLSHNLYNRGSAFTNQERESLGLVGLLPHRVTTLKEQTERAYGYICRHQDPLERFVALQELEARNAVLFYRLVYEHLEEFMPVVYTPTVGQACQQFSHIFRRGRGIWITPEHRGHMAQVLKNAPWADVRLIVITDNQSILGLGDLGAGGMGIPVGKLALYTVGAGIHPAHTLPISVDVGTDNEELLRNPFYMGVRQPRLKGAEYDSLIEEAVTTIKATFPKVVLQWEDFRKSNAFTLLDRYRERLCSFNDDIQGTAGVALAGVMAAGRISQTPFRQQRVLIVGGGAAGIGIARQLREALASEGVTGDALTEAIGVTDSGGLLHDGRSIDDAYKESFAWPKALVEARGLSLQKPNDLLTCINALKPTVLIGTSGQPNTFSESVVRAMLAHVERPAIFPFSNPNAMSEGAPADLIRWTDGKALIATGSPFGAVTHAGKTLQISQGNNVYVFPGVGLGAIVAEARMITDGMLKAAALALAGFVKPAHLKQGLLFPPLRELNTISAEIGLAVAKAAVEEGVAPPAEEAALRDGIQSTMWVPSYPKVKLE